MLGRGRSAGLAVVGVTVALACTGPPAAHAGVTYGDLDLSYTGTTTNWIELPGRQKQNTYDPCASPAQLVGNGVWVGESILSDPFITQFKLGKAYNVSFFPFDQFATPEPDSTRQVAETRFKQSHSLVLGESTVCGESLTGLAYPKTTKDTPAGKRTTAEVDCGPGTNVISGGVKAGGPFRSQYPVRSFPFDDGDADGAPNDGWRVSVDNTSGRERSLTAYAICTTTGSMFYEASSGNAKKNARDHVQVDCQPGQYILGGGVTHDVEFGEARLVASRFPAVLGPTAWITEVDNLSGHRAGIRTYAICHT